MDTDEMRRTPPPAEPKLIKPGSEPKPDPAAKSPDAKEPAAGPHARPGLTDNERTPGAGALADPDEPRDQDATG